MIRVVFWSVAGTIWAFAQICVVLYVFVELRDKGDAIILGSVGLAYCQITIRLMMIHAQTIKQEMLLDEKIDGLIEMIKLGVVGLICLFNIFLR